MSYSVLVVEDDPAVAKGLVVGFTEEGFQVQRARNGQEALRSIRSSAPHVVLLDIRLPDMNGFDVCRTLRTTGFTAPVIMVTAKDEEVDRILGLEIGADDYVVKPFSFRELVSRVRAQIRRCYGPYRESEGRLHLGGLSIDTSRMEVRKGDEEVLLTPIEYKLLHCLAAHPDVPLSREQLIAEAWGSNVYLEDERTVDVHIRHLRQKIEDDPAHPSIVETVRGFGYRGRDVAES